MSAELESLRERFGERFAHALKFGLFDMFEYGFALSNLDEIEAKVSELEAAIERGRIIRHDAPKLTVIQGGRGVS